jgi:hypothetical protein
MAGEPARNTESAAAAASDVFEVRMPADTVRLASVRRRLCDWLEAHGATANRDDIVLAASELAAAAIRAASTSEATVLVRAWPEDDAVVVESGAEVPSDRALGLQGGAFDGNEGERGFSIVAALSDVFAVKDAPTGVVVRARVGSRFDTICSG